MRVVISSSFANLLPDCQGWIQLLPRVKLFLFITTRSVRLGSFPVFLIPIRTPFIELLPRIRVLHVASDVVFAVPLPRLSVDDSFSLRDSLGACSESRKPIVPFSLACPSRSPGTRC